MTTSLPARVEEVSVYGHYEVSHSYRIIYSRFSCSYENVPISLIPLVGAGRFERPTPCAQDLGTS